MELQLSYLWSGAGSVNPSSGYKKEKGKTKASEILCLVWHRAGAGCCAPVGDTGLQLGALAGKSRGEVLDEAVSSTQLLGAGSAVHETAMALAHRAQT